MGIVSELYKAHSDLSGIMVDHSAGNYEYDYPFTIAYVDEENKKLVVGMHPMAAVANIEYTVNEIQQVLETSAPIKIIYAEFIPETATSSTQTYYETFCTPDVSPGYINVCKVYADILIRNGVNPADLGPYTIFLEAFSNMRNWNTSGDDIEDDDLGSDYGVIPGHTITNDVATNDDECDTCVMYLRNNISISEYDHATLTFWKLVDREFESGDYLKVEVYDGNSWTEKFKWTSGNNSWRQHTLTLDDSTTFNMRITASIADDDDKFGIDNIVVKVENDDEIPATPADTTPPVITVPADISGVPRNYSLGYYAEFTVTATDDTDGTVNVTCNYSTGYFSIGVTDVSCTATDAAKNIATASFTVTVTDGRPTDTDGDGFHDGVDQCPAVASSVNYGCPATTTIPSVTEFYGGQEIITKLIIPNNPVPQHEPGTITIGATKTNGQIGFVTAGHIAFVNPSPIEFDGYYLNGTLKLDTSSADILVQGMSDAAFIPITESNISVSQDKIITKNGTLIDIIHGSTELLPRLQSVQMYGKNTNSEGSILFKNATLTTDTSRILTKMIIAHYDSMGGDSGASVIITENNTNALVGIHKGYVCQFIDSDGLSINVRHDVRFCMDADDNGSNYYKIFTPWETVKSELRLR